LCIYSINQVIREMNKFHKSETLVVLDSSTTFIFVFNETLNASLDTIFFTD
jgi:hypothetical protein